MPASPPQIRRAERRRRRLVATARKLFATRGYDNVTAEEIATATGVTRGALYHHFADKRDLFRVVLSEVTRDWLEERTNEPPHDDPLDDIRAVFDRYMDDAVSDIEIRQIFLFDAPRVLGLQGAHDVGDVGAVELLENMVVRVFGDIQPRGRTVSMLARMLLAAFDAAATTVAYSTAPAERREDARSTIDYMIEGLRRGAPHS